MELDLHQGIALIEKARAQEQDNRFFAQWVVQLPFMGPEDFMSFREYKELVTGANVDFRPVSEILAELDEVEAYFEKKGGNDCGT